MTICVSCNAQINKCPLCRHERWCETFVANAAGEDLYSYKEFNQSRCGLGKPYQNVAHPTYREPDDPTSAKSIFAALFLDYSK